MKALAILAAGIAIGWSLRNAALIHDIINIPMKRNRRPNSF